MKTVMFSILCLLSFIAQAAQATDPAAKLSTMLESNRKEILIALNKCRKNVKPTATNMLVVKWNNEAQATAAKYAKGCIEKHSVESQRTLPSNYSCGENLFFSSHPLSWTEAIEAFCNESKHFAWGKGTTIPGKQTGHYTQCVWNRSNKVGCEVAYCPKAEWAYFYVCHQCPPGNVGDKTNTPYNPGKTCADCPGKCSDGLCTNPCDYNTEASNCADYKDYCDSYPHVKASCPGTCKCKNGEIM